MRLILALLVALIPGLIHGIAAADAPRPGELAERVSCKAASGQTYACYLPKAYDKSKRWPILFCFDPGGNGHVPVRLYRPACEALGWIVVGSNNSRNGPIEPIRAAMTALWADVGARFSIDDTRLYATGFSGGSYVAMLFAHSRGTKFAGVISVGAGMPRGLKTGPARGDRLLSIGLVGQHDYALGGMLRMRASLRSLGLRAHIWTFDGGHEWPPASLAAAAVRRCELVHRASVAGSDITELLAAEGKAAEAGPWFDAYRRLKDLATLLAEREEGKALAARVAALEADERFARESAAHKALEALGAPASYASDAIEAKAKAWKQLHAKHKGTAAGERAGRLLGWAIHTCTELANMVERRDPVKAKQYRAVIHRLEAR